MHEFKSLQPMAVRRKRSIATQLQFWVRTSFLVVIVFFMLMYIGQSVAHAFQYSQFASSEDGPVKYRWQENDGTKKCSVIESGKAPISCERLSKEKLEQIVLLWEKPEAIEVKFGCAHC